MSLNAGGLAQMTYQPHNSFNNMSGLGVPNSGFASRGKGSHIKRLSVAPPTSISTIDETQQANPNPTPRTSRSHLLAGLRTAPKSPGPVPNTAPPSQTQQYSGASSSGLSGKENNTYGRGVPHTAIGAQFGNFPQAQYGMNNVGQMYSLPDQILAPPALQMDNGDGSGMDPHVYAELVATNQYLAQQQMRLQQQLMEVTAAAQQFQGMNLSQQQQFAQQSTSPGSGYYSQQLQQGLQPIVQAVQGQPGLYSVYNPMTGQSSFVMDSAHQEQPLPQPSFSNHELSHSPPPLTPTFRAQVSPPPDSSKPFNINRNNSPPRANQSPPRLTSSPPQEVDPLPPPSANAFRRSHKKASSFAAGFGQGSNETPKSGIPRSAGFPITPMTGTFGPGQARAGEHPIRQPRGPPSLEDLVAKPTSKYEGSKNFVTRQRRRAVNNLVRAGLERRGASRGSGSIDSLGTPASEPDLNFSIPSDNDSDSVGSRSGSSMSIHGAIGSERKMKERSQERGSTDSYSANSVSSEDGTVGGKLVEVKSEHSGSPDEEKRRTPLLVLTSAEKRKSNIF
ncbi:hypothetical protein G7Y79_00001g001030 [Physcia stellaris]|nr:hypothetical protein G7Y79_00001g001030 [Physcia stellaris]